MFELALRQPADRKIRNGVSKWSQRRLASSLLPPDLCEAPKRALQTPQREWLRGPLSNWATEKIEAAIKKWDGTWLIGSRVRESLNAYLSGAGDNSFFVWQWVSLGLLAEQL